MNEEIRIISQEKGTVWFPFPTLTQDMKTMAAIHFPEVSIEGMETGEIQIIPPDMAASVVERFISGDRTHLPSAWRIGTEK